MTTTTDLILNKGSLTAKQIRDLIKTRSLSESTWRVMFSQCKKFIHWGGKIPSSPESVCDYLTHLAKTGIKSAGLDSAKWAIDQVHKLQKIDEPSRDGTVSTHLKGLKRILVEEYPNQAHTSQKRPITINDIRKLTFSDDLKGLRDRALMLVGFASGMRRSELTTLRRSDIEATEFGVRIKIWKSKSNQEGLGETVDVLNAVRGANIDFCPTKALMDLLEQVKGDYVFQGLKGKNKSFRFSGTPLSGVSIGQIIKSYVVQLGLDQSSYGGHSLRAGLATYLLDQEIHPAAVQKQMRHKRFDTTQRYNRGETARVLVGSY